MKASTWTTDFIGKTMTHYFEAGIVAVLDFNFNRLTIARDGIVKKRLDTLDMSLKDYNGLLQKTADDAAYIAKNLTVADIKS